MTEDFFTHQDRVFDLTEKVLRLCGESAYQSLPAMSLAEDDTDLDRIEDKANNLLRLRRNAMARARRRRSRPAHRGRYTHKQVFTMFLREYGPHAKRDDAWRIFKQENEIVQCVWCGGYSNEQDDDVHALWWAGGVDLFYFCDEVCKHEFLTSLTEDDLPNLDEEERGLWRELMEERNGNL